MGKEVQGPEVKVCNFEKINVDMLGSLSFYS